jgi:hypothetical protein
VNRSEGEPIRAADTKDGRVARLVVASTVSDAAHDMDDALDGLVSTVDDLVRNLGTEPTAQSAGTADRRGTQRPPPSSTKGTATPFLVTLLVLMVIVELVVLNVLLDHS